MLLTEIGSEPRKRPMLAFIICLLKTILFISTFNNPKIRQYDLLNGKDFITWLS